MQSFLRLEGQLLTGVTDYSPSCVSLLGSEKQHKSCDFITGEKCEPLPKSQDTFHGEKRRELTINTTHLDNSR